MTNGRSMTGKSSSTHTPNIVGEPGIGKIAEVQASQLSDGRLLARAIRVVNPADEASLNALVADIVPETSDTERWDVIVFPESPWADPRRPPSM